MSKKPLLAAAVAFLLCALAYAAASPSSPPAAAPSIGLAGTLKPLPDGSYLFAATITDLQTREALAAPQLHFASGDTAKLTLGDKEQDRLELTVSADKAKGSATVDLSRIQGGRALTLSRFDLQLQ